MRFINPHKTKHQPTSSALIKQVNRVNWRARLADMIATGSRVNATVFVLVEGCGPDERSQGSGKYRGYRGKIRFPPRVVARKWNYTALIASLYVAKWLEGGFPWSPPPCITLSLNPSRCRARRKGNQFLSFSLDRYSSRSRSNVDQRQRRSFWPAGMAMSRRPDVFAEITRSVISATRTGQKLYPVIGL